MTHERRVDVSPQWRIGLLAREAALSVRTSRRLRPLVVAAVLIGPLLAAIASSDAASFERDRATLDEAGARVILIAGATESSVMIDRSSCESLAEVDGIERAGALLASTRTAVVPIGPSVALVPASISLVPALAYAGAVTGPDLVTGAMRIQRIDTGAVLDVAQGSNQPEGVPLDRAVAVRIPDSVTTVDRCIVIAEPGAALPIVATTALGALEVSGSSPVATPVLAQPLDATEQYLQRPTRWAPLALGIIAGLATVGLGATRLSEFAAYRLSGTRRRELAVILGLEAVALSGIAALSSTAAALAVSPWLVSAPTTAMGAFVLAGAWWVIAAIGSAPLVRISALNLSKER